MKKVHRGSVDLKRATVILPAGGKGERLADLAEAHGLNKCALKVGNLTMIERTIRLYTRIGIKRFVVLVFHRAESIKRILGDGRKLGISVTYSMDPARPIGKGGAILLAVQRGIVPTDTPLIVHNPDDQIVGIENVFARRVFSAHRKACRKGALGTAVCVPWTRYAYSSFTVRNGMATSACMYPKAMLPAHTGITILEPQALAAFRKLIDPSKKIDFESVVFPHLARKRQLGYAEVPTDTWIPVNDFKSYNTLVARLKKQ